MQHIYSYNEITHSELDDLSPNLTSLLIEDDESKLDSFLNINLPIIFQDILINIYLEELIINESLLSKFTQKLNEKAIEILEEIIELFDSMKEAVIKMNLINHDNNLNIKAITSLVMDIFKSEKSEDIEALDKIN